MDTKWRAACAVVLVCVACGDDEGGHAADAGNGTGGRAAASGGRASSSGGASAGGGSSSGGSSSGGSTPAGGASASGGSSAVERDASTEDASADAGVAEPDSSVDGGDSGSALPACIRNHETPAGRYRIAIHNVITRSDCQPDQQSCGCVHTETTQDGEAILTLTDFTFTERAPDGGLDTVTIAVGKLEAPSIELYMPGFTLPEHAHEERYGLGEPDPMLSPWWYPSKGLPNPLRLATYITEYTLDTKAWTVTLHRRFSWQGECGTDYTSVQTGTGTLDCGDD